MKGFQLRDARPEDAPAMAEILTDWLTRTPWLPNLHTPQQNRAFCGKLIDQKAVTVAEQDQHVVGFLAQRAAEIDALYVAQGAWRQGIGHALLSAAKAKHARLELWTFQANLEARAFYACEGFFELRRTDGQDNDEKLPDIRFAWERTPT
ncbi:GNAT family N-acetyltransferase [Fluviibacterium sp. DFM31]|uniref:GNAT family N-acetyltransferase n=1 Tax=Meridianimarinicoccus marinus TaxID=3231483 RepID=A0ABV3L7W0_9RHOB